MSPSKSPSKSALNKRSSKTSRIDEIIKRFAAANPHPQCELYHRTPYQLLVSVLLSAQATDKGVNACMKPHYDRGLSVSTILRWGEAKLKEKIRTIGLAPTKARNIVRLTQILVTSHNGEIPKTREALEALPGIGRKSANVILGEIFNEPALAVDTHVLRTSRRLGLHQETDPTKCEQALLKLINPRHLPQAHHWLVQHGRYVCKARKPECESCSLSDICPQVGVSN